MKLFFFCERKLMEMMTIMYKPMDKCVQFFCDSVARTMSQSTSIRISREFEAFWKPFTRAFQALCVSHYSIFRPNLRENRFKSWLFFVYFFTIFSLHMNLIILTTRRALRCEDEIPEAERLLRWAKHRESALMYYVNALSILGGFATHIASHMEVLFSGKREEEIYEKLQIIDNIFVTKLNHVIDYKTRRANYIKETILTFVLVTISAIASSFISLPDLYHDKYFMQPILIFPMIINRFRWCYIALFLNNIGDILNDLQILLKQQQIHSCDDSSTQSNNKYARENIRYFREIYSYIWYTITLMSDCFGWSFIFFLVEFTFEFINASYWLYINLTVYGSIDLNIRKCFAKFFFQNSFSQADPLGFY